MGDMMRNRWNITLQNTRGRLNHGHDEVQVEHITLQNTRGGLNRRHDEEQVEHIMLQNTRGD